MNKKGSISWQKHRIYTISRVSSKGRGKTKKWKENSKRLCSSTMLTGKFRTSGIGRICTVGSTMIWIKGLTIMLSKCTNKIWSLIHQQKLIQFNNTHKMRAIAGMSTNNIRHNFNMARAINKLKIISSTNRLVIIRIWNRLGLRRVTLGIEMRLILIYHNNIWCQVFIILTL